MKDILLRLEKKEKMEKEQEEINEPNEDSLREENRSRESGNSEEREFDFIFSLCIFTTDTFFPLVLIN